MRSSTLILMFLLPGCLSAARPVASAEPTFAPEQFFLGRTEGIGSVKVVLSQRRAVHVSGIGRMDGDDTIVLDQTVERSGAPTNQREWRLRRLPAGRYDGTLSDAVGPVAGIVSGACFHVRYSMKSGVRVEQFLYLRPDGQTVVNRMTFRKLGLVVGRLDETIRHVR